MHRFAASSFALVTAVGFVSPAANAGLSSSMAATCTVGDPAIQNNLYTIAFARLAGAHILLLRHVAGCTETRCAWPSVSGAAAVATV